MQTRTRFLIFVLIPVLLAVVIYVGWRQLRGARFAPTSIHDSVTQVVKGWANMPALPDDDAILEVLWAKSGSHFEFYPSGAQDLANRLTTKFKDSKIPVILFTDINGASNPQAKVKNVGDLAKAVIENYEPE